MLVYFEDILANSFLDLNRWIWLARRLKGNCTLRARAVFDVIAIYKYLRGIFLGPIRVRVGGFCRFFIGLNCFLCAIPKNKSVVLDGCVLCICSCHKLDPSGPVHDITPQVCTSKDRLWWLRRIKPEHVSTVGDNAGYCLPLCVEGNKNRVGCTSSLGGSFSCPDLVRNLHESSAACAKSSSHPSVIGDNTAVYDHAAVAVQRTKFGVGGRHIADDIPIPTPVHYLANISMAIRVAASAVVLLDRSDVASSTRAAKTTVYYVDLVTAGGCGTSQFLASGRSEIDSGCISCACLRCSNGRIGCWRCVCLNYSCSGFSSGGDYLHRTQCCGCIDDYFCS